MLIRGKEKKARSLFGKKGESPFGLFPSKCHHRLPPLPRCTAYPTTPHAFSHMLPGKEREAIDLFSHFPELTRREEEEETYRYFPSTKTLCSSPGKQSKKDWKTFWRRRLCFLFFSSNPFSFFALIGLPPFFSISCLSSLSIVSLTDISICRQVLFIRETRGGWVGG